MAIVNVDFKSLEVVTAAWLSQDQVMMEEILAGTDMHEANRLSFGLPNRGVAKILKFRILYGGTAYSFSKDPDFIAVSKNVKFWEDVIEKYYTKYKGLKKWHDKIIKEAATTGKVETPFGRVFEFELVKKKNGDMEWPVTDIKNYPVQGTGADIVCMSRVMMYPKLMRLGINVKQISTVHDSIVVDCSESLVPQVVEIFSSTIRNTPTYLSRYFDVDFNLPLVGEVSVGPNMLELVDI